MTPKSLNTRYVKLIRKMTMAGVVLLTIISLLSLTHWSAETSVVTQHFVDEQKLIASDGTSGDEFGSEVAASGSIIVVGARADDNLQGSAYVFERQGGSWIGTQKLIASDRAVGDQFSFSIAVSGSMILVGAPNKNIGGNRAQGTVYIFERQGPSWIETQRLTANDGSSFGNLGLSVAINGSTIVAGSSNKAAYVFNRHGGSWVQTQKLTASDVAGNDNFGVSVAIGGSTIVVGASTDDIGGTVDQGSAYVFEREGRSWVQMQKLTASDGAEQDDFGKSVSISGSTIVVGAPFDTIGSNLFQGSAYVFERNGGSWIQTQKLTASDPGRGGNFGNSVAVSGSTIIVGAPLHNDSQGGAFVFNRDGGSWIETRTLAASDGLHIDFFGTSVAITASTVVVGAPFAKGGNFGQGAAYVFGP